MSPVKWEPEDVDCGWDKESVRIAHDGIKHMTDLAVLFNIDGDDVWLPKSVIASVDADEVWVAEWFAERENLV